MATEGDQDPKVCFRKLDAMVKRWEVHDDSHAYARRRLVNPPRGKLAPPGLQLRRWKLVRVLVEKESKRPQKRRADVATCAASYSASPAADAAGTTDSLPPLSSRLEPFAKKRDAAIVVSVDRQKSRRGIIC